jgi:acetylornithine deacetylase/succinyl-diaminopimelate desuccinylase-like protein
VRWIGLQNSEKRPVNVTLTARGASGHASMPRPDNPLVTLSRGIARLVESPFPVELTPETRAFFPAIAALEPDAARAEAMRSLAEPARSEEAARRLGRDLMFGAMLRHTISPTILRAGFKANVIPSSAEATLNVRLLPGADVGTAVESIRERVADPRIEVSYTPPARPASPVSRFSGPLVEAVQRAAARRFPGAPVAPYLSTGATDSAELRQEGIPAYGLLPFPLASDDAARMHADDERMPAGSLLEGLRFLLEVVEEAARGG